MDVRRNSKNCGTEPQFLPNKQTPRATTASESAHDVLIGRAEGGILLPVPAIFRVPEEIVGKGAAAEAIGAGKPGKGFRESVKSTCFQRSGANFNRKITPRTPLLPLPTIFRSESKISQGKVPD